MLFSGKLEAKNNPEQLFRLMSLVTEIGLLKNGFTYVYVHMFVNITISNIGTIVKFLSLKNLFY